VTSESDSMPTPPVTSESDSMPKPVANVGKWIGKTCKFKGFAPIPRLRKTALKLKTKAKFANKLSEAALTDLKDSYADSVRKAIAAKAGATEGEIDVEVTVTEVSSRRRLLSVSYDLDAAVYESEGVTVPQKLEATELAEINTDVTSNAEAAGLTIDSVEEIQSEVPTAAETEAEEAAFAQEEYDALIENGMPAVAPKSTTDDFSGVTTLVPSLLGAGMAVACLMLQW